MKKSRTSVIDRPSFKKTKYWGKLVSISGVAQLIVQFLGFLSGILIVRLLPVEEYALYTLANTMLGAMTILSDGGISAGVMSEGGKVWKDKGKLGAVLMTGLNLRRKFAIGSLLITIPILSYLLYAHGASAVAILLITVSLIPAFYATLSDTLLQIPSKLHQSIVPLQKNQVEVSLGRLVLTTITLFVFPWAFVAIIANGIPRIYGNIRLKKIASLFIQKDASVDGEVQKNILKSVKRILPGSIYYAISGQLTIWLISIFGSTAAVAELGALTRFTVVFTFFTALIQILIIPRFARLHSEGGNIQRKFIQVQSILYLITIGVVIIFILFSDPILWILGSEYNGLNVELVFVMIGGSLTFISSITNALLSSRGIILPPYILIPLAVFVQIVALFLVPLDQIVGVIIYGICTTLFIYLIRLIYFYLNIRKNEING